MATILDTTAARLRPLDDRDSPGTAVHSRGGHGAGTLLAQSGGFAWVRWAGEDAPHTVPAARLWVLDQTQATEPWAA